MNTSIAIIADLPADNRFRVATNQAIEHAATAIGAPVATQWLGTDELASSETQRQLESFHALWIGPGSPYKNMAAALVAIQFAREREVPLLGTCGGFQHIVLEYARAVLGISDADHAETDPYASVLFISRLACSLVGRTMSIQLDPNSLLARAYGKTTVQEGYYCNFGVNPKYIAILRSGSLRIVASDGEGEVRAVELPGHPFFVGTLFLPQLFSTAEHPHPIIVALLQAAIARK